MSSSRSTLRSFQKYRQVKTLPTKAQDAFKFAANTKINKSGQRKAVAVHPLSIRMRNIIASFSRMPHIQNSTVLATGYVRVVLVTHIITVQSKHNENESLAL